MLLCNAAGEKCPKVAENFFIAVIKIYPKVGNNSSKMNVNKNCLQDIFCVCDYVAVSRCFCYGGWKFVRIMRHLLNITWSSVNRI